MLDTFRFLSGRPCPWHVADMRKFEPYTDPSPRRPWTRAELEAAVACVRAMAEDEATGQDPRRTERQAALAAELDRGSQAVRLRLSNIAHVLREASLPAPDCVSPLPGVGRRIAAAILDAWHALDAEEDLAASVPAIPDRRPWDEAELAEALSACRRMESQEATLGRPLDTDEAGDAVSEVACQTGRRWSETRRVMADIGAMDGFIDGTAPRCLEAVAPAVLVASEATALERLREGKEG